MNNIHLIDSLLFQYLNGFSNHTKLVNDVIYFFAAQLQYVLGAILIFAAIWPRRRLVMPAVALIAAGIARGIEKEIIIHIWARARPSLVLPAVGLIKPSMIYGEEYQSFPSGHAIFFFALAAAVYHYDRRLGWLLYAGATAMGVARVMAGVHWPTDIIGGAVLGIITGWLTVKLATSLLKKTRFAQYA
jgi:undecaprenyl-diphosphatase